MSGAYNSLFNASMLIAKQNNESPCRRRYYEARYDVALMDVLLGWVGGQFCLIQARHRTV